MHIDVPIVVQNKAHACGESAWLDSLPSLVEDLASAWGFRPGAVHPDGTEALVLDVVMTDGPHAVLKLLVPRDGAARNEIRVLELADGDGCPALYRSDHDRSAMLMERLGPSMFRLGLPIELRHTSLVGAARRLWRPAPSIPVSRPGRGRHAGWRTTSSPAGNAPIARVRRP